jgi:hypothetical protein
MRLFQQERNKIPVTTDPVQQYQLILKEAVRINDEGLQQNRWRMSQLK